jgi:hypothetical protein
MNVMKDDAFNDAEADADADSTGRLSSNSDEDDSVWGKGDNDSTWGGDNDDFSDAEFNAEGPNTTRSKAIPISRIDITPDNNKLPPTDSTSPRKKRSSKPVGGEDTNKRKGKAKNKNQTNKKKGNRDDAWEVSNFNDSDVFQVSLSGVSEDELHVPLSGEPRKDPFEPRKLEKSSPSLFAKIDGDIADSDMTMDDVFMQKTNSSPTALSDRLNISSGDLPLHASSSSKKNVSTKDRKSSSRRNKNNDTTGKPPSPPSLNNFPLASKTGGKGVRISDIAKEERGSERRSSEKSARSSEKSSRSERSTDKFARSELSTVKSSRAERSSDRQTRGDRLAERRRSQSTDGSEKARRIGRSKSTDGLRDRSIERSTRGRSKTSEKPPSDRKSPSPTLVTRRPAQKSPKRSHSPGTLARSRRARSVGASNRSSSPGAVTRSRSPVALTRSRSPGALTRSRSPGALSRNRTNKSRDESAPRGTKSEDLLKESGDESKSDKKLGEPKRGRRPPGRAKSLGLELMIAHDRSLDDGLKVADANPTSSRRHRRRSDEKSMGSDSASRRTASFDEKLGESDDNDFLAFKSDVDGKSSRRAKPSKQLGAGLQCVDKESESALKSRRRGDDKSLESHESSQRGRRSNVTSRSAKSDRALLIEELKNAGEKRISDNSEKDKKEREKARLVKERRKEEEARVKRLQEEARVLEGKRFAEEAKLNLLKEESKLLEGKWKDEEARLRADLEMVKEQRLSEESKLRDQMELAREQRLAEDARMARLKEELHVEQEKRLAQEVALKDEARLIEEKQRQANSERQDVKDLSNEISRNEAAGRLFQEAAQESADERLASTVTTVIPPLSQPPMDEEIKSEAAQVRALNATTEPKAPNRKKSCAARSAKTGGSVAQS